MAKLGERLSESARAKISAGLMGHGFSPEARAKMSATRMGNNNCVGRCLSEETRAKIGARQKGRKHSEAEIQAMAQRQLGTHRSAETRAKMSAWQWRGGPAVWIRKANSRRRTLGFALLNQPFVGCEAHHVDNDQVINIPKVLHRSIYHRQTDGRGMAKMNAIAYNFLFKQEVEAAFAAKETQ